MKKPVDFADLALKVSFSPTSSETFKAVGLEFRKGKGMSDIVKAHNLAQKNSGYKTEEALGFMEIYLSRIFKKNHIKASGELS